MDNDTKPTGNKYKLQELINNSKMPSIEKTAWIKQTEEMPDQEIEELTKILQEEKRGLMEIDDKYRTKINRIKEEFNQKWLEVMKKADKSLDEKALTSLERSDKDKLEVLRQRLK